MAPQTLFLQPLGCCHDERAAIFRGRAAAPTAAPPGGISTMAATGWRGRTLARGARSRHGLPRVDAHPLPAVRRSKAVAFLFCSGQAVIFIKGRCFIYYLFVYCIFTGSHMPPTGSTCIPASCRCRRRLTRRPHPPQRRLRSPR